MEEKSSSQQEEVAQPPEKQPAYVPPATPEKRRQSVFKYITILFAAAFLLMLMTYMMERRQNEAVVDSLNQSVSGLRESISNMQSDQDIYEKNMQLIEELSKVEQENMQLQEQLDSLTTQNEALSTQLTRTIQATDLFWQINEAYVKEQYTKARSLIERMEQAGLVDALPTESTTDNGRFSPADRYQEIYQALY